jgi:thiazole/oxazole-forming peptide maturase SagC family component
LTEKQSPQVDGETLLKIAEGLDLVLISADEVLVQFGTRSHPSQLLRDSDLTGLLGRVISPLLDGPKKFSQLLKANPDDVSAASELIANLLREGVLADSRSSSIEQYLRYTFAEDSSFANSSVAMLGVGPVGARIARGLVEHGVSRLILVDGRPADATWYRFLSLVPKSSTTGDEAVQHVLARTLLSAGHSGVQALDAKLDVNGVEEAIAYSDLVILALEHPNFLLSHLVNRLCLQAGRPWLQAQIDGNMGIVGPLFAPPHTACFNCFMALADAATLSKDMARKHRQDLRHRQRTSFFAGLPAYADIVSSFSLLAIVHFLLRQSSFVLGRALVCNLERMILDVEDVLKLPRCPACTFQNGSYHPPISLEMADTVKKPLARQ